MEETVHEYDVFSMYGFSTEYPDTWKLELNAKGDRTAGDAVFKAPRHRSRTSRHYVYLSWGPLELVKEKYGSLERHAEASVEKIRKGSGVLELEVLENKKTRANGHKAIYNRFKVTLGVGLFAMKKAYREVSLIHWCCEKTGRFFVLSESIIVPSSLRGSIFQHMKGSFRCH